MNPTNQQINDAIAVLNAALQRDGVAESAQSVSGIAGVLGLIQLVLQILVKLFPPQQ